MADHSNSGGAGPVRRARPGWVIVFVSTLAGVASWVGAAAAVALIPPVRGALDGYGPVAGLPFVGLLAGILFGLITRSGKLQWLCGALAGLFGTVFAYAATFMVLFAFFHNETLGWLGNAAFPVFLSAIFCPIFGAATLDLRAVGLFALVGFLAALPFGVMIVLAEDLLVGWWTSGFLGLEALTLGFTTGLATGIHQAREARRGPAPAGDLAVE